MLDPFIFSDSIESKAKKFLSLTDNYTPLFDDNGEISKSSGSFIDAFADAFESYSLSGEVLGATHGLQQKELLKIFLSLYSINIIDFATALANYFSTVCIVNGVPSHGGISVVSVTNDALSHIPEFVSAIESSYTTNLYEPIFHNLINNIESIALPSITWIVTELVWTGTSFVPIPFLEKIT